MYYVCVGDVDDFNVNNYHTYRIKYDTIWEKETMNTDEEEEEYDENKKKKKNNEIVAAASTENHET